MIYIILISKTTSENVECKWKPGDGTFSWDHEHFDVVEVQAEGAGLMQIREDFANLPMSKWSGFQRWFGDHARFIAANLT